MTIRIIFNVDVEGITEEEVVEHLLKNDQSVLVGYARSLGNVYLEELVEGSDKIEASMAEAHVHKYNNSCQFCSYQVNYHAGDIGSADPGLVIIDPQ